MENNADFFEDEQKLSMLVDALYDSILESKEPEFPRYCEAILVLNYMHSEYEKISQHEDDPETGSLPESFLSEKEFPSLFIGSADYMKEEQAVRPQRVREIYNNCVLLYGQLKKVAEKFSVPVSQKLKDIEAVTGVLRTQSIQDGRDPFKIITVRDKYQP